MLNRARHRASRLGIPFTLTLTDFSIPTHCPVLGIPLFIHKGGKPGFFPNSPSLDRLDNTQGYIPGNVLVISARANALKSNATIAELQRVLTYMQSPL